MKKFIVNPVTGDYESTSYTFGDRFGLKDGGRINFGVGSDPLASGSFTSPNMEYKLTGGSDIKRIVPAAPLAMIPVLGGSILAKKMYDKSKTKNLPSKDKKPGEPEPPKDLDILSRELISNEILENLKNLYNNRRNKEGREDYSIVNKENNLIFLKKFKEIRDKYYGGRTQTLAKALKIPRVNIQAAAKAADFELIGRPSGSEQIIAPVENGIKLGELTTRLKNDSQFRESFIKKHEKNNSYLDGKNIGNLWGVNTSIKGNVDYITEKLGTGKFQSLGVKTKKNEFGQKTFNVKDAAEKVVANALIKPSEGGSGRAQSFRYKDEKFSDKIGFNLNKTIIRQVNKKVDDLQGRLPNRRQKVDLAESGHSIDISFKKQFPKLFKDAMNINNLVSQEADINKKTLRGFQKKYKGVFKELEPLVDKKVTPKIRETLLNNKLKMDNLNEDILIKIKEKMKENPDLYRHSDKRRADITLNVPEVGEKFKPTNIKVDMSKVDKRYIIGNIDQINPDAKKVSDLSEEEFKTYAQNIINQKADEVNVKYTLAEYDQDLIDELVESVETYEYEPIPKQNKNMGGMIEVMDETMMMAQGGRVNFSEGSPDPDFLKMTMAARENENIPFNPIKNFNEIINPKAFAGYAQKIAAGVTKLGDYAMRIIPAAGEVASDVLTKKPGSYLDVPSELFPFSVPGADIPVPGLPKGTLENFGKNMQPKIAEALIEKIGLQKLIDESDAKATGSQKYYGDMLELGTELLGPATAIGYFTAAGKLTKSGIKELQKISGKNFPKIKAQMEEKISAAGESRRDFNKTVALGGMIGLAKVLGLDNLLTTTAKVASKVPAKIVTAGGTPKYFFDFVSLIRKSGDDVSDAASTVERQKVYDYNGYTMYEDISTGEIRITDSNSTGGYKESNMSYSPGKDIVDEKTGKSVKSIDEYEEVTGYPDRRGDMDSEVGLDSIDDILELLSKDGKKYSLKELGEMGINPAGIGQSNLKKILKDPTEINNLKGDDMFKDTLNKIKYRSEKAGGGIMKLAGDGSGPPPTSGPNSQGLALILKRAKQY